MNSRSPGRLLIGIVVPLLLLLGSAYLFWVAPSQRPAGEVSVDFQRGAR